MEQRFNNPNIRKRTESNASDRMNDHKGIGPKKRKSSGEQFEDFTSKPSGTSPTEDAIDKSGTSPMREALGAAKIVLGSLNKEPENLPSEEQFLENSSALSSLASSRFATVPNSAYTTKPIERPSKSNTRNLTEAAHRLQKWNQQSNLRSETSSMETLSVNTDGYRANPQAEYMTIDKNQNSQVEPLSSVDASLLPYNTITEYQPQRQSSLFPDLNELLSQNLPFTFPDLPKEYKEIDKLIDIKFVVEKIGTSESGKTAIETFNKYLSNKIKQKKSDASYLRIYLGWQEELNKLKNCRFDFAKLKDGIHALSSLLAYNYMRNRTLGSERAPFYGEIKRLMEQTQSLKEMSLAELDSFLKKASQHIDKLPDRLLEKPSSVPQSDLLNIPNASINDDTSDLTSEFEVLSFKDTHSISSFTASIGRDYHNPQELTASSLLKFEKTRSQQVLRDAAWEEVITTLDLSKPIQQLATVLVNQGELTSQDLLNNHDYTYLSNDQSEKISAVFSKFAHALNNQSLPNDRLTKHEIDAVIDTYTKHIGRFTEAYNEYYTYRKKAFEKLYSLGYIYKEKILKQVIQKYEQSTQEKIDLPTRLDLASLFVDNSKLSREYSFKAGESLPKEEWEKRKTLYVKCLDAVRSDPTRVDYKPTNEEYDALIKSYDDYIKPFTSDTSTQSQSESQDDCLPSAMEKLGKAQGYRPEHSTEVLGEWGWEQFEKNSPDLASSLPKELAQYYSYHCKFKEQNVASIEKVKGLSKTQCKKTVDIYQQYVDLLNSHLPENMQLKPEEIKALINKYDTYVDKFNTNRYEQSYLARLNFFLNLYQGSSNKILDKNSKIISNIITSKKLTVDEKLMEVFSDYFSFRSFRNAGYYALTDKYLTATQCRTIEILDKNCLEYLNDHAHEDLRLSKEDLEALAAKTRDYVNTCKEPSSTKYQRIQTLKGVELCKKVWNEVVSAEPDTMAKRMASILVGRILKPQEIETIRNQHGLPTEEYKKLRNFLSQYFEKLNPHLDVNDQFSKDEINAMMAAYDQVLNRCKRDFVKFDWARAVQQDGRSLKDVAWQKAVKKAQTQLTLSHEDAFLASSLWGSKDDPGLHDYLTKSQSNNTVTLYTLSLKELASATRASDTSLQRFDFTDDEVKTIITNNCISPIIEAGGLPTVDYLQTYHDPA